MSKVQDENKLSSEKKTRDSAAVVPLAERLRAGDDGWAGDPAPLVGRLERSKAASLFAICPDGTHVFRDGREVRLPARYQDAARLVADEWDDWVEYGNQGRPFSVDPLSDETYDVFLFLWLLAGEEVSRRVNRERKNFLDCEELSRVFPALGMPLPELFQAACESTADSARKRYFKDAYGRFRDLLEFDPKIKGYAVSLRKKQPIRWVTHCDLATMASVLMYVHSDKLVSFDLVAELLYDLLILPFAEEAPLPCGTPISSGD